jgi:glycosyltransferase involved in cell wall biosynthesis
VASSMTDPLVSAVLPTYNRTASLNAAIESVLTQEYENLELLVIDDASADEFRPNRNDFTDRRVRVIVRDVNGGVAAAQNTGLAAARGEYVAFIHSDDVWLPIKLRSQVDLLERNSSAAAAESATNRVGHSGSKTVPARLAGATSEDLFHRRIRNLHISGFTFRSQTLRSLGGFDEDLRAYEDFDLLLRLMRGHLITCSDDVVAAIDQAGSDRLAESPWMWRARSQLLQKYDGDFDVAGGQLPDGWRDWAVQLAVQALVDGNGIEGRRKLALANRGRRGQSVKYFPLYAASFGERSSRFAAARAADRLSRTTRSGSTPSSHPRTALT